MRIDNKSVDNIILNGKGVLKIKDISGNILYQKQQEDVVDYFWIECPVGVAPRIRFIEEGGNPNFYSDMATKFEYSFDKKTWVTARLDMEGQAGYTITDGVNKRVYFRNDENAWSGGNENLTRMLNFNCANNCGGDLRTLLNYKDIDNVELPNVCFGHLFRESLITDASQLKIAKTGRMSYHYFFSGCSYLTVPPVLPTTLNDYCFSSMFRDCTSLVVAPELPATTIKERCYTYMFYGCTSLTTVQTILPATTLANNCYSSMFYGCESLTNAPQLPAAALSTYCYYSMFRGCTSLTSTPYIGASSLVTNCFNFMFYGCSNISFIDMTNITNWNENYAINWVNGVSTYGEFYKQRGVTIPTGTNGIPDNWDVYQEVV